MRTRLHTHAATVSLALATAVLTAGSAAFVPRGPALGVGAALAALGAVALTGDLIAARRRRSAADAVLESLPSDTVPAGLRWRVEELTNDRERRRLARALRGLLKTADDPRSAGLSPVPVNWRTVRRERRAVEEVSRILADTSRPVSARGVLLVRHLMFDAYRSPLYSRSRAHELARWLDRARTALPRRPD